jgi:Tol biopolymer transport system component
VKSTATNYTITATNTGGSGSASFSLQVKNQPLIAYYSTSDLSGAANGTATGSNNVWTVTLDGIDQTALTSNTNASLDTIFPSFISTGGAVVFSSLTALSGSVNGASSLSYNIWTENSDGSSPNPDTDNSNSGLSSDYPPSYSPSGTQIVFASKTAISGLSNGTAAGSYNIWIMNTDGTGKLALTQNTNANLTSINPVFSPNGTEIYFQSKTATSGAWNGTATNSYNIWKVAPTGGTITHLTSNTAVNLDSTEPHVSPDSSTIVFTSKAKISGVTANSTNIWKVNNDGTGLGSMTSNTSANFNSENPSFSPDGSEIVYASQVGVPGASSSYNIWKMKYDGSNQIYLTTNTASGLDSVAPSYSPDNLSIAFQSKMKIGGTTVNSNNIWMMNQDGTNQTPLTTNTNSGLDSLLGITNVWYQQ